MQAIVDATDDNSANIAYGYAAAVVDRLFQRRAGRSGWIVRAGRCSKSSRMVVQSRVWFNEDLESRNFIIPGVVALVMALVGAQLTSLTISREWERGTMELLGVHAGDADGADVRQARALFRSSAGSTRLSASPRRLVVRRAVSAARSSALFFTTSLFLIVVLGIGYLISVLIRSQVGASQIALLVTMLPTTLLSGYVFPIDQMPRRCRR